MKVHCSRPRPARHFRPWLRLRQASWKWSVSRQALPMSALPTILLQKLNSFLMLAEYPRSMRPIFGLSAWPRDGALGYILSYL